MAMRGGHEKKSEIVFNVCHNLNKMIDFKILSFNIFCPVIEPIRFSGQKPRAQRVKDVIQLLDKKENLDVIIINEIIVPEVQTIVTTDMDAIGFRYHTQKLSAPLTPVSGGTVIFSKHPIVMEDATIFGDKCKGADCLAAKGVVFARVMKNGWFFNVFGTHMQAWDSLTAQVMREAQIQQIYQFIEVFNISPIEPVFFCGDMNIDLYTSNDHLKHMMHKLKLTMPEIYENSYPFTVDPEINKLVGADDPDEYTSAEFPNGCKSEYLETLKCPCCPKVWIDYTLFSTNHLQPQSSSMEAIPVKVPKFLINFFSPIRQVEIEDISDHTPVLGRFTFDPPTGLRSQAILQKHGEPDTSNVMMLAIFCAVIVVIALMLVSLIIFLVRKQKKPDNDSSHHSYNFSGR